MISLRSLSSLLSKKQFDVRLRTGNGLETRVVERPGLWMTDDELGQLAEDLRTVAKRTLKSGDLTYGVFSKDRRRLEHSIITVIRRSADGKPVAFNALALMELSLGGRKVEVLHLGLVMVDPDERSRGLSWILYGLTCFLVVLRNQFRPIWISNVTQVPAVAGMVAETFADVYPSPLPTASRSLTHVLVARQIMKGQRHVFGVGEDAVFDERRFVIENAYTGGSDDLKKTYDEATKHRDDRYNEFCRRELDYDRGDDVLQLGQVNFATWRAYLAEAVPRGSLSGVMLAAAVMVLQRLLLPIYHWSDDTQAWGMLRPWKE